MLLSCSLQQTNFAHAGHTKDCGASPKQKSQLVNTLNWVFEVLLIAGKARMTFAVLLCMLAASSEALW
ncbi:hypothetical protein L596_004124 [Steinernema carpocapsae]|uniref:Uncharacterized protein n=1 Tax=Steinernema carpocapsae TaxID=34508 RepID=A0A4U8UVU4_STECR|nr:hypothetical protein L596_004124 [Steinernema carpocapsae]